MTAINSILNNNLTNNDVVVSTNFLGQHTISVHGNLVDLETAQRVHTLVTTKLLDQVRIDTIDGIESNGNFFANVDLIQSTIQEANANMNIISKILRAIVSLFKRSDIENFFSSAQLEGQTLLAHKQSILDLTSPESREQFFFFTWEKQKAKIEQMLSQVAPGSTEEQPLRETLAQIESDPIWAERNLRHLPLEELV